MKRNLDLIRSLLEIFEAARPGEVIQTIDGDVDLGGASPVEVLAHISLLIDAGMLEGECHVVPDMPGGGIFGVTKITWSGHDFLDASRDNDTWNSTKRRLAKAGSWTFSLVLEILKEEAKKRIGLGLPDTTP